MDVIRDTFLLFPSGAYGQLLCRDGPTVHQRPMPRHPPLHCPAPRRGDPYAPPRDQGWRDWRQAWHEWNKQRLPRLRTCQDTKRSTADEEF